MPRNARIWRSCGAQRHVERSSNTKAHGKPPVSWGYGGLVAVAIALCWVLVLNSTALTAGSVSSRGSERGRTSTGLTRLDADHEASRDIVMPPGDNAPAVQVVGNQLEDQNGDPLRLVGVDATGTQDACVQANGIGWGGLNSAEAAAIASWHANAVRVPLNEDCWLGINGVDPRFSGKLYQAAIEAWVSALNGAGLVAILDLHWSAPGTKLADEQWPMADADHSITFWREVATSFKSDPSVIFDLFNEPYLGRVRATAADWTCWLHGCKGTAPLCPTVLKPSCKIVTYQMAGMQQMLDAVRSAGASQPVMVGGLAWAGDPCGIYNLGGNGGTCSWLKYEPTDPLHQLIDSFHTYNWTACRTLSCWNQSVAPVAAVAPVVTGELGEKDCSAQYIDQYMEWADQNGVSYLAWAWQPSTNKIALGCGPSNTSLLSSWTGTPSTMGPAGSAYAEHLTQLATTGN